MRLCFEARRGTGSETTPQLANEPFLTICGFVAWAMGWSGFDFSRRSASTFSTSPSRFTVECESIHSTAGSLTINHTLPIDCFHRIKGHIQVPHPTVLTTPALALLIRKVDLATFCLSVAEIAVLVLSACATKGGQLCSTNGVSEAEDDKNAKPNYLHVNS